MLYTVINNKYITFSLETQFLNLIIPPLTLMADMAIWLSHSNAEIQNYINHPEFYQGTILLPTSVFFRRLFTPLEHKHDQLLLLYKNKFNVFWDVRKCRQVTDHSF
jgi:hypothetical protein